MQQISQIDSVFVKIFLLENFEGTYKQISYYFLESYLTEFFVRSQRVDIKKLPRSERTAAI